MVHGRFNLTRLRRAEHTGTVSAWISAETHSRSERIGELCSMCLIRRINAYWPTTSRLATFYMFYDLATQGLSTVLARMETTATVTKLSSIRHRALLHPLQATLAMVLTNQIWCAELPNGTGSSVGAGGGQQSGSGRISTKRKLLSGTGRELE